MKRNFDSFLYFVFLKDLTLQKKGSTIGNTIRNKNKCLSGKDNEEELL